MMLRSSAARLMLLLGAVVPVALAQMPAAPSHPTAPVAGVSTPAPVAAPASPDEPCSCASADDPTDEAPSTPCASAETSAPRVDPELLGRVVEESFFLVLDQRYPILGWLRTCENLFDRGLEEDAIDIVSLAVEWMTTPVAEATAETDDKVEEPRGAKAEFVSSAVRQAVATTVSHCPVASVGVEPATCARLVLEQFCPPLALAHSCPYVEKQVAEFARPCLDCTVNAGQQFVTDCLARAATGETQEAQEASEPANDPLKTPDETPAPDSSKNCRREILDIFANEKEAQSAPAVDAAPTDATPKDDGAPEECEQLDVMPMVTADDNDDDGCPICPHCPAHEECPAPSMEMTCPYLNKQKAAEACPRSDAAVVIPDVLENLENLTKARDLMDQCEKALAAKDYTKAKECCEWVTQHCSGSRWAAQACQCQLEMHQAQAATEAGVGLCYPQDCDTTHEKLKTAHHLMKKGDHYRLKGQFEKAARYYRKVETLCPESKVARRAAAELQLIAAIKVEKSTEEAEPPMPAIGEPLPKDMYNPTEENTTPPSKDENVPDDGSVYKDLIDSVEATHFGALVPDEEVSSIEQRCAEAVEAGQRALTAGNLDEAEHSAQAALGLDCDCVAAQVLMKQVREHRERACDGGGAAPGSTPEHSEESEPPATADDVVDWEMLLDSTKPENAPKNSPESASLEQRCEEFVAAGKEALEEGKLDEAELAAKTALCLDCDSVDAQELLKKVHETQKKGGDEGCHTDRGAAPASPPEPSEESEPPMSESGLKHRLPPVDPQLIDGLEGIEEQSTGEKAPTDKKESETEPNAEKDTALPPGHYLKHQPQYFAPSPTFPLDRELATMEDEKSAAPVNPPVSVEVLPPPTQDGPEADRTFEVIDKIPYLKRLFKNVGYGSESGLKHRFPSEESALTGNNEGEIEQVQVMPQPVQDGPEATRNFINIGYGRDTTALLEMVTPGIIIINSEEEQMKSYSEARDKNGAPLPRIIINAEEEQVQEPDATTPEPSPR